MEKKILNNIQVSSNFLSVEKKRSKGNWKQRLVERRFSGNQLETPEKNRKKAKAFKKSLLYIFFLKKLLKKGKQQISYINLPLLKVFLTKYAKIKPRRKTHISLQQQKSLAKSIKRARTVGLLPFITKVTIKRSFKKRKISTKRNLV